MRQNWKLALAGLALAPVLVASAASATAYVENISASPSDLSCGSAGGMETCVAFTEVFLPPNFGTGTYLGGSGIVYLHDGDTMTIDLSYTSPLLVPGSATESVAFAGLIDYNGSQTSVPTGGSTSYTTLAGYSGPASPATNLTSMNYAGAGGFGVTLGGNPGPFSTTGLTSLITITHGDANPIVIVEYGYQIGVPEPATWAIMILGFGLVGAAVRAAHRRPAIRA